MRTMRTWGVASVAFGACMLLSPASTNALTYLYTFDRAFDWDDVAGPAGMGGHAYWEVVDAEGNPGGALHIYTNYWHKDYRSIQINAKPGTTVRVQFDIRVPLQDFSPSTYFQVRYYDGYVSALSFDSADDLDDPYPPAAFRHDSGDDDVWRHVDFTTPALQNPVFTLCFQVEGFQSFHNVYYLDNLRIDFTPSDTFNDPGLVWDNLPGGKFVEWRQNSFGRHVAWCDFLEERNQWFDGFCNIVPKTIDYNSWYDTTQTPFGTHYKTDFKHNVNDAGAYGVFRVAASHDADNAKSCGIRQTVSYAALGLAPGQLGTCEALMDASVYDGWDQQTARFWLGIDPYGGRDVKEERYPDCTGCCNGAPLLWDPSFGVGSFHNMYTSGGWDRRTIQWQRPTDAEAFTVIAKFLDVRGSTSASEGANFLVNAFQVTSTPVLDPQIGLNKMSLAREVLYAHPLSNDTFTVRNLGTGTINYTISDDADWLSESPDSGSSSGEEDTIEVSYNAAGLSVGEHTATITVESNDAVNSPQEIAVTVTVTTVAFDDDQDGDVDVNDFVHFQACFNGPDQPYAQPNCDNADYDHDNDIDVLDYTAFQVCFNGPDHPPGC